MNENAAKVALLAYLTRLGLRPHAQPGAGPDVLCDGTAIEVKGTDFRVPDLLKQLTRYAFTQADVAVAFPVDALSLSLLYGLATIEGALKWHDLGRPRTVAVYLVAEDSGRHKIRRYESVAELRREADEVLGVGGIFLASDLPIDETVREIGSRATHLTRVLVDGIRERIDQLGADT